MKRYILFSGSWYYPCGGWNDFDGIFETPDDAANYIVSEAIKEMHDDWCDYPDWAHLVDAETMDISHIATIWPLDNRVEFRVREKNGDK